MPPPLGRRRRAMWVEPGLAHMLCNHHCDHLFIHFLVLVCIPYILARGHDEATVRRIEHLLYIAEYKRRQAPPGVKITHRAFGKDRRLPIVNRYRQEG